MKVPDTTNSPVTEQMKIIDILPDGGLHGRRKIFSDYKEVTANNVVNVLSSALAVHSLNAAETRYLWNVYKGIQDIRLKTKYVRENINNIITVNKANEIVTFKSAFLLSAPVQYTSNGDDTVSKRVNRLNRLMAAEDKNSKDKEIVDWMHINGVAVRMCLQDEEENAYGSPAEIFTLDPREAFCIYNSGIEKRKIAGVVIQKDETGKNYYCVYTRNRYFEVHGNAVTVDRPHIFGEIPIFEYENNMARTGSFELVLPILDAINKLESCRVDNVEDFVNAYDVFQNCEIEDGEYQELAAGGKAVMVKSATEGREAKVYRISSEMNQTGVQNIIDDLTDQYLTICGMPNRNGGSSTSDTGTATIFRDGWAEAESRAKDSEKLFKRAEKEFLRVFLNICSAVDDVDLSLNDINIEFTRENLTNIQSKAQVLCEMLNNEKIHPKYAFQYCGMFPNPEEAYSESMKYYEEQQAKLEEELEAELNAARTVSAGGQGNQTSEPESD